MNFNTIPDKCPTIIFCAVFLFDFTTIKYWRNATAATPKVIHLNEKISFIGITKPAIMKKNVIIIKAVNHFIKSGYLKLFVDSVK